MKTCGIVQHAKHLPITIQPMGILLAWVLVVGCGGSSRDPAEDAGGLDAGRPVDAGRDVDAGRGVDAGGVPDAGRTPDTGVADTGIVPTDAGTPTCDVSSCEMRVCGRSFCGASCGECAAGSYCMDGACRAGTPPGSFCVDAFAEYVPEGSRSFRTCPVDDSLLQSCLCTGGGADAWTACGDCQSVILAGARGDRCATDAQCGGLACHPTVHLCGERCDRGAGTVCPAGTRCGYPGDIAGVCLSTCETCGSACSDSQTCRASDEGGVCAPSGYGWARSC